MKEKGREGEAAARTRNGREQLLSAPLCPLKCARRKPLALLKQRRGVRGRAKSGRRPRFSQRVRETEKKIKGRAKWAGLSRSSWP